MVQKKGSPLKGLPGYLWDCKNSHRRRKQAEHAKADGDDCKDNCAEHAAATSSPGVFPGVICSDSRTQHKGEDICPQPVPATDAGVGIALFNACAA